MNFKPLPTNLKFINLRNVPKVYLHIQLKYPDVYNKALHAVGSRGRVRINIVFSSSQKRQVMHNNCYLLYPEQVTTWISHHLTRQSWRELVHWRGSLQFPMVAVLDLEKIESCGLQETKRKLFGKSFAPACTN